MCAASMALSSTQQRKHFVATGRSTMIKGRPAAYPWQYCTEVPHRHILKVLSLIKVVIAFALLRLSLPFP